MDQGDNELISDGGPKFPRIIEFQFNPESLKRTLKLVSLQDSPGRQQNQKGGRPSDPRELNTDAYLGETISINAVFDGKEGQFGSSIFENDEKGKRFDSDLFPVLSALERLMQPVETTKKKPAKAHLNPPKALPMVYFWWGRKRILPVKITQLQVTETEFAPDLYPVRAEVGLEMEVLVPGDQKAKKLWEVYKYSSDIRTKAANHYFNTGGQSSTDNNTKSRRKSIESSYRKARGS